MATERLPLTARLQVLVADARAHGLTSLDLHTLEALISDVNFDMEDD